MLRSNTEGPRSYHPKRKSQKERQAPYETICMRNLKYDPNERICGTDSYTENRLVVAKAEQEVGGKIRRLGLADEHCYTQDG